MSEISRRHFLGASAALAAAAPEPPLYAANDRIQIGVIGTGARSQEIMQALLEHKKCGDCGVADAYKGRLERALDRVGGRAKAYPTWHEIIDDKSIDAVVVATPDHWHKEMVVAACAREKTCTARSRSPTGRVKVSRFRRLRKRISAFCRSEPGRQFRDPAEGQRDDSRRETGKITMIGLPITAIRRPVHGSIRFRRTARRRRWIGMRSRLGAQHAFSPERFFRWRCYQDYSGGIATDLFVHLCTTIHYLMNATAPARVIAMGQLYRWKESRDVPDTLNAILEYPEGFTVNLSSTFNNQLSADGSFQFLGTEGRLN